VISVTCRGVPFEYIPFVAYSVSQFAPCWFSLPCLLRCFYSCHLRMLSLGRSFLPNQEFLILGVKRSGMCPSYLMSLDCQTFGRFSISTGCDCSPSYPLVWRMFQRSHSTRDMNRFCKLHSSSRYAVDSYSWSYRSTLIFHIEVINITLNFAS
jgi:hypothetical protein